MDKRINLFGSEPYLIEVGDNVTITEGVRLITHDGGAALFRKDNPGINVYGRIQIRDNSFIGTGSTIMPNVKIGPNAVVGAGAVVTHDVPENTVVVGVPAKVLCLLDEYKRRVLEKGVCIIENEPDKRMDEILKKI